MAFHYDRIRRKRENADNVWTAYSDLFTSMAFLFLMLYVCVSLRNAAQGVQARIQLADAKQETEDMREQMRAYDALKKDYLETGASEKEREMYKRLMSRLTLLQDEATQEKEALQKQAAENAEKAAALNQYQKIIRNIINANMVAQSDIKKREDIIQQKVSEIEDVSQQLTETSSELSKTATQLKEAQTEVAAKQQEVEKLAKGLKNTRKRYVKQIEELQAAHVAAQEEEKQNFLASLEKEKLSAKAKIAREREYRKRVEEQSKQYGEQLADLNSSLAGTKRELAGLAEQKSQLTAQAQQLEGDLKRAQSVANYKRELAQAIRKSLGNAGVSAEVDPRTGDVTLSFGKEYFDTNETSLKPGMKQILEKFMPVYAHSLFADQKIAQEIKSVELIGFASPTYKRRYVDPSSLAARDQKAVNYNMDLSYQRAKSIFNYIFDTNRVQYSNQSRLLPLVKVTGRSYLASKKNGKAGGRAPASMDAEEFCRVYNCMESQKVIIKFNLEE